MLEWTAIRRVRLLAAWFFIQPLLVGLVVGALLGELLFALSMALIFGVSAATLCLAVWLFRQSDMRGRGYRW